MGKTGLIFGTHLKGLLIDKGKRNKTKTMQTQCFSPFLLVLTSLSKHADRMHGLAMLNKQLAQTLNLIGKIKVYYF